MIVFGYVLFECYVHCFRLLISAADLRHSWNVIKVHIHKETVQEFAGLLNMSK